MADTELPSVATVNDEQAAALLECYGSVEGWKTAMIQHMLDDIKHKKQAEIQAAYSAAMADLNAQERAALADVETLLDNLVNP